MKERKFKLIGNLKGHEKGLIVSSWNEFDGKIPCYKTVGTVEDFKFEADTVENNPEFWEEMESHRFYLDEQVTVWRRSFYEMEDFKQKAIDRMKQVLIGESDEDSNFYESIILLETEVSNHKRELFDETGELIDSYDERF